MLADVLLYAATLFCVLIVFCLLLDFHFGSSHQTTSKNTFRKNFLRAKAADRREAKSLRIDPPLYEPLIYRLTEGPVVRLLDRDVHWLTRRERFLIFIGVYDAWSIESELDFKRQPQIGELYGG